MSHGLIVKTKKNQYTLSLTKKKFTVLRTKVMYIYTKFIISRSVRRTKRSHISRHNYEVGRNVSFNLNIQIYQYKSSVSSKLS